MRRGAMTAFAFALSVFCGSTVMAQWVRTNGPSGGGGTVYSVAVMGSRIFAGTPKGVFVSANGGTIWSNFNFGLPQWQPVTSLAVKGTLAFAAGVNRSIWVSSDSGAAWESTGGGSGISPATFFWLVASDSVLVASSRYEGLNSRFSTDNGSTWTESGCPSGVASMFARDSLVYAATRQGIARSADNGRTWSLISGAGEYSAVSDNGSTVFAGNGKSIYRSDESGTSWQPAGAALGCKLVECILAYKDGTGGTFVFAGTDSGIFRSTDNGSTWNRIVTDPPLLDIYQLLLDSAGTTFRLFAATSMGLLKSTDQGISWTRIGVPQGSWSMSSDGTHLFAGMRYESFARSVSPRYCSTIFKSTDNGDTWVASDHGIAGLGVGVMSLASTTGAAGKTIVLAGTSPGGVFVSTDAGDSWTRPGNGISSQYVMALHAGGDAVLAASSDGIFRSENGADGWTRSDSGTTDSYFTAFATDDVNLFAGSGSLVPRFSGRVLRNVFVNDVFVSTDNGVSWAGVDSMIADSAFLCSLASVSENLIAGTGDYHTNSDQSISIKGGVYLLERSGENWIVADSSLVGNYVHSLAVDGRTAFAGTEPGGAFRSTDGGLTWEAINQGLTDRNVTGMLVAAPYLFAATPSGIWRRPLSEVTSIRPPVGKLPVSFGLSQNYPNPFNPSTVIQFAVPSSGLPAEGRFGPQAGFVSLKVYDVLGREVATLVAGRQSPGAHSVVFNGSKFASGVYFYRLTAPGVNIVRKMLLEK